MQEKYYLCVGSKENIFIDCSPDSHIQSTSIQRRIYKDLRLFTSNLLGFA